MPITFKKAERRQVKFKAAIIGPSGSGKTGSALLLAAGMGQRIAVIDTENESAALYADMDQGPLKGLSFDVLAMHKPYTVQKYVDSIDLALANGYDVLIIDSISHAWAGEGGLLAKKDALDARPNSNSYINWNKITPEHERFRAKLLEAPIHLICTMRSKQDYILEDQGGKKVPKKVGMAPIQRDGMEYEFTTVLELDMGHYAQSSKDRTGMFDGLLFQITRETGKAVVEWIATGKPAAIMPAPAAAPKQDPAPAAAKLAPAQPAAAAEQPDAKFPDEPAPADAPAGESESDVPAITEAQTERTKAAIEGLKARGKSEEIIWKGIHKAVADKGGADFVELADLAESEGDAVIAYLEQWAAYHDELAAKADEKPAKPATRARSTRAAQARA